jgi:hypothetical protein
MSPAAAFAIILLCICLAGYIAALIRWGWLQWKERRDERKRIEEHTDEYWRQIG